MKSGTAYGGSSGDVSLQSSSGSHTGNVLISTSKATSSSGRSGNVEVDSSGSISLTTTSESKSGDIKLSSGDTNGKSGSIILEAVSSW